MMAGTPTAEIKFDYSLVEKPKTFAQERRDLEKRVEFQQKKQIEQLYFLVFKIRHP